MTNKAYAKRQRQAWEARTRMSRAYRLLKVRFKQKKAAEGGR